MVVVEAQVTIQIVIPTVRSRLETAHSLALRTGGEIIVDPLGDGSERSATDNHVRAMQYADPSSEWIVILEDDADPIDNFTDVLREQLSSIDADKIVSLYLGKQRPPSIQPTLERTIASAPEDTSWLVTRMLYWGVGVCIPGKDAESVADHVLTSSRPWDTSVGHWALTHRRQVWYSWPSLVDHLDGETSIHHADGMARPEGRHAWRTGVPVPGNKTVMIE